MGSSALDTMITIPEKIEVNPLVSIARVAPLGWNDPMNLIIPIMFHLTLAGYTWENDDDFNAILTFLTELGFVEMAGDPSKPLLAKARINPEYQISAKSQFVTQGATECH